MAVNTTRDVMLYRLQTLLTNITRNCDIYREYVESDNKSDTELFLRMQYRLTYFPDESPYFYLPRNQQEGESTVIRNNEYLAYVETLKWLAENDEKNELMLLLYRGSHFLSFFQDIMKYNDFELLSWLMDIDSEECDMDSTTDYSAWLSCCPLRMKSMINTAETVGCLVTEKNKSNYAELRTSLMEKFKLSLSDANRSSWSLAPV